MTNPTLGGRKQGRLVRSLSETSDRGKSPEELEAHRAAFCVYMFVDALCDLVSAVHRGKFDRRHNDNVARHQGRIEKALSKW